MGIKEKERKQREDKNPSLQLLSPSKKTLTQMLKCTDGSICAKEQCKGLQSPTRPLEIVTPGIYDWGPRSYEIKKRQLDQIKLGCVSFTP